jgi:ubiquinone/menaquinone biosynthesis C-methylase UbiE
VRRPPGPKRWFFDVWSYVYDAKWVQRAVYQPEQDAVLAALRERPPAAVLDVGCGTGQLAHRMQAEFPRARVVGCDFSAGMLQQARARDGVAAWVQGDAGRLPFGGETFDAVVSTQAFHWFPDQRGALRELARVLRVDGRLLMTVVVPPFGWVRDLASSGSRLLGQPFHWMSAAELRRAAAAAGLRVEWQRAVFRLPGALLLPPLLTVARRMTAIEVRAPHRSSPPTSAAPGVRAT